jgi:hypothetical protein
VSRFSRRTRCALWRASGRVGRSVTLAVSSRLTVLITLFHPVRAVHADAQVRNVLRCRFVEKVVVSSHNPDVNANASVRVRDPRLTFVNAPEKRGCGHRWTVAAALDPDSLLVIDDDVFLGASQIAGLFQHLVSVPRVPHGLSGIRHLENDGLDFVDRQDVPVDYLCEVYAVTRQHLRRYAELRARVANVAPVDELIDSALDFMVVSCAGSGRPRIHDLGHILRCETFKTPGVAVHKRAGFETNVLQVAQSLRACGVL